MKKRTICRSSGLAVLAALAMLGPAPLAAQEPGPASGETRVHVVRRGETLWTLAEYYLGDPLLWPTIYRLNPNVVEDPHWIFPGEELLLIPPDTMSVAPTPVAEPGVEQSVEVPPSQEQEAPPPAVEGNLGAPTVFAKNWSRHLTATITSGRARRIRGPSRSEFYSAGFLTEGETLSWAAVEGATDQSTFGTLTATSSAVINESVALRAPEGATYQVGDTLFTAVLSREVTGWGRVVKPTGLIRVDRVAGREVVGTVIAQFNRVADGQVAMPVEPFRLSTEAREIEITNGMEGHVIATRDRDPVPGHRDVLFIDLGRTDGVALGDLFEVMVPRPGFEESGGRRIALMKVVHLRPHSSSVVIVAQADIGIKPGTPVRLISRTTS